MNKILLFALVFFFCFVLAGNQAISANSPLFDDYLSQGIEAFHSREYHRSYELLLKAFDLIPDDYRANFYLGRSAFELHNYEMAVMTYERVLIMTPQDLRVKLEMARAYQKLGMNDMARKYCNQVLLTDPPQTVKQNIEKFLAYIDRSEQKHFFRGTLSLGIDWNDNVWASPANNIFPAASGIVTLTGKSAQKTEDIIFSGIADLNHTYVFPYSPFVWQTNFSAYKALYRKESELDTLYLDIESGPEYINGKGITGLQLTADYLDLEESKYSSSLGIKSYYRHMFTPSFVLSPVLAYKNKTYEKISKKNADNISLDIDTAFLVKNVWCDTTLGYEHESAADSEYSYNRYSIKLYISREFSHGVTLFGSYDFFYTRYDGLEALFDKSRRDKIHYVDAGIKKRLWQSSDQRQSITLTLGYQYTKSLSNLDLYDYTRNVVNSSMEYRF